MLDTRDDLMVWLEHMLPADFDYCDQAGAAYTDEIRRLEALLRPLWAVLPVYFGPSEDQGPWPAASCSEPGIAMSRLGTKADLHLRELRRRVEAGDLPEVTTENRQVAVEMAVLGFAIGKYRERFLELFSPAGRERLVTWLLGINGIEIPPGNWYFFVVLVNAALRANGLPHSPEKLSDALVQIESFRQGDHWYTDGPTQQLDYYVSFAFHFYGMIYAAYLADGDDDPYAASFRARAVAFAQDFQYWFDDAGRSLPFGRSLTYRFAHVSFWSALVATGLYRDCSLPLGRIKGIILRNLRFWQRMPITAPKENNLTVGYGYAQALMAEDYNAPGSPMWAFKTFMLLDVPAGHPFWTTPEEPLSRRALTVQPEPGFLIAASSDQVTALSARQCCGNRLLYCMPEKYGKFAYSTYFGFNIGRGTTCLDKFAIDSTLAFSVAGHDQFASRDVIDEYRISERYGVSRWRLWGDEVAVTSYLVPVSAERHIRIHVVDVSGAVDVAEGGFPLHDWNHKYNASTVGKLAASVHNERGVSAITDLAGERSPQVVAQGPNTNLYSPERNGVPALVTRLAPGRHVLACAVEGIPGRPTRLPPFHPRVEIGADRIVVSWDEEVVDIPVEK